MDKILVTRPSMPELQEYIDEIAQIWESHWMTNMGVKHQTFQRQLIEYLGVEHLDLLTNGHMALELSIQALGLKGEVITTPFTFASTTHAIVRNGLTPVFCDIDPVTFTIDTTKIESLITENTSAIVPVHVYGNICCIEEIQSIADKYGLKVIYDAAHSFGETYNEIGIGNFGDVSCFSFHATKVFNSIEGGCAVFHDKEFGKKLYQLKNFGIKNEEVVDGIGANAKMNEFCAAMGICNLRHIDDEIKKRKKVVECYRSRLEGVPGIQLNCIQKNVKSNYAYFPIIVDEKIFGASRDEIYVMLAKNGIGTRKYFYPLTSTFDCYAGRFDASKTPIALDISKRILTLPLYSDLDNDEVIRICGLVKDCGNSRR